MILSFADVSVGNRLMSTKMISDQADAAKMTPRPAVEFEALPFQIRG